MTAIAKIKTCESGTCLRCGAKLSVYRKRDELYCAPCTATLTPYRAPATKERAAEVPRKA
jgi:hypothetical protein